MGNAIGFGIGALLIENMILFDLRLEKTFTASRKHFKELVLVLLVCTVYCMVMDVIITLSVPFPEFINLVLASAGLVLILLFGIYFCAYLYSYTRQGGKKRQSMYLFWIFDVAIILIIINFFNGILFYFDDNGVYCLGPLAFVPAVIVCIYLLAGLVIMLKNINKYGHYHRTAIVVLLIAIACSVCLQLLLGIDTMFIVLITAIGTLGMYMSMEAPDYELWQRTIVELDEARREADRASQSKTEYLANMSHEIRTPINAVLGMNEMILRESGEEEVIEYALRAKKAGESLLSLINDVLDVSKVESGKLEIVLGDFELQKLINDAYSMVADKLADKGLDFYLDIDENLPAVYSGDQVHLRQVLVNLLNNSVKYTDMGSVSLKIRGNFALDTMFLTFDVIDTGIGIKEEDKEYVFMKYSRSSNLKQIVEIEGTGLGLRLVVELVDLMDGKIEMDSIFGVGSRFTVNIPLKVIDSTAVGKIELGSKDYDEYVKKISSKFKAPEAKVLIVDDLEDNLNIAKLLLKETEVVVDTASSGTEAIDMVQIEKYDIIFMDHLMPGMDGIETLAEIRKLPVYPNADTPVIMLTANAISGLKEKYEAAGFVDYITKPIINRALEDMICKYLPKEKIKNNEQQ